MITTKPNKPNRTVDECIGLPVKQNQARLGRRTMYFVQIPRRQLISALIANRPALAAILFYYFTTGARYRGRR